MNTIQTLEDEIINYKSEIQKLKAELINYQTQISGIVKIYNDLNSHYPKF